MAVADSDRQDELERAWFGDGEDPAARRAALLEADTDERAAARSETLELLDLAIAAVADRATALADAADTAPDATEDTATEDTAVEDTAEDDRRSFDTQPMMEAITPESLGLEPAPEPEPDVDPEPHAEPEPEPDVEAGAPPSTPAKKAARKKAAKAAAAAAVEEAVREDALETASHTTPRGAVEAEDAEILPPGVSGWQAEVELLYNDVLRLFSLGDTDGALVSLERLLIIAPINDQIRNFLRVNESKLMKLYEGVMGPWSNVPRRLDADNAPSFFKTHAKFKTILHLVDGKRDLGTILEESYFLPLETCAVLNQLIRSKVILAHDVPL